MECRMLKITLISADNLPDVRIFGRMKVYAEISIKGKEKTSLYTPVDTEGETNPRWNCFVNYPISESSLGQAAGVSLVVKLMCKRSMGDRLIGEVEIQVKSLFDMGLKAQDILSYNVAGTSNGRLNVLYSFGDKCLVERPSKSRKSAIKTGLGVVQGANLLLDVADVFDGNDEVLDDVETTLEIGEIILEVLCFLFS